MKKLLMFFVLFCFFPVVVFADDSMIVGEYGSYDDAIEIVQEMMKDYYIKGPYLQYNLARATYGTEAPEEATSQDNKYAVCAAFTYDVYAKGFGMYNKSFSTFPKYNYNVIEEAFFGYNGRYELDGSYLLYYQSTVDTDDTTDSGVIREREKVKYVYQDTNTSSATGDFETLVSNVKPGDIFVYTGHTLIAYDVVTNPSTNKKDVLLLNVTADEYIRTRIYSTSRLTYNFFKSPNGFNNHIDVEAEGAVQWLWLSNSSNFVSKTSKVLTCAKDECAVIRPFYEKDGKAVFNYSITPSDYAIGKLRTEYPGLSIEKTVNVGDNDSVYIDDTLKYTIKVTNNSGANYKDVSYNSFVIEETIDDDVLYLSSTGNPVVSGKKLVWNVDSLSAGSTVELTYTVNVKNSVSVVGNEIIANGKFYKTSDDSVYIATGEVKNKIIPKVTKLNNSYKTCYDSKNGSYTGLNLINEIYKCVNGVDYKFKEFDFSKLFVKGGTSKTNATMNFNSDLDENHKTFKNMILNKYFGALAVDDTLYYLPRWTSSSADRAKHIIASDFKDGDVLIYNIKTSKYTDEYGTYAYIYIDGKFVGVNRSGSEARNQFVYTYYANAKAVSDSTCSEYGYSAGTTCNYFYNLYEGYSKLSGLSNKEDILEFINYQTLMDKNNYIILRPEIVMKEVVSTVFQKPTKSTYIQNYEKLDLTGGLITSTYNDGVTEKVNLSDTDVNVTGFDNSKIGKQTLTAQYGDYKTSFDIEVVSKQITSVTIKTLPTKKTYIQNYENLDLTGGVLEVKYNDESTDNVSFTNENVKVSGFDNSKVGKQTITVQYAGYEKTFDIEVLSKQIASVSIKTLPSKKTYTQNYEKLDLTGGVLEVKYNDESTDNVSFANENVKVSGFDNSKVGKQTITIEYAGYKKTFEVEVVSKQITSVSIKTLPSKKTYTQNYEKLDLTGGVLEVKYSDDTTDNVSFTNENVKVSGFDNSKVGKQMITVQYGDYKTSFEIEVVSKQIESINIKTLPVKKTYIQNYEKLDLTGGVFEVKYNDKSTDDVSFTNENVKVSGFDNSRVGKQTITIEYAGYKKTFEVEVVSKQITSVSIKTLPVKKIYVQNYEKLDLAGGILEIKYNDESTDNVSFTNKDVKVSGFDNSKVGKQTITAQYAGYKTSFEIEVVSKQIESISIKTLPAKKSYIQNYEKLDLTGGVLEVKYSDDTTDNVSFSNGNVKVSGFDNSKIGKNTIIVEYADYKITFEIEIISKQILSVDIATLPSKIKYNINEKINLKDGILVVKYNDGSIDNVSFSNEKVKISSYDNAKIGKQVITVEYIGHKTTFEIEIKDLTDSSVVSVNPPTGINDWFVLLPMFMLGIGVFLVFVVKRKYLSRA